MGRTNGAIQRRLLCAAQTRARGAGGRGGATPGLHAQGVESVERGAAVADIDALARWQLDDPRRHRQHLLQLLAALYCAEAHAGHLAREGVPGFGMVHVFPRYSRVPLVRIDRAHTRGNPVNLRSENRDYIGPAAARLAR